MFNWSSLSELRTMYSLICLHAVHLRKFRITTKEEFPHSHGMGSICTEGSDMGSDMGVGVSWSFFRVSSFLCLEYVLVENCVHMGSLSLRLRLLS